MNDVLSARAVPRSYKEDNWSNKVISVRESVEKKTFLEDLSAETEEFLPLEAVTR
jgi:hypothetical protein